MTEIYTVYIYHVSNRKRSLAEKSFILCYFMQKNVKVSAWHKVSKHLCWHSAVLRTVVGINISFSLSKTADAKVSYFYFNINKTSPVDVKRQCWNTENSNYQYLCCKLKREWQKNVSIRTETQPTTGSKQHKYFIHCISFACRFSELFTTAVFKVPRLVKTPFLGIKCKLVLPELPTHRMRNANESRSAPYW